MTTFHLFETLNAEEMLRLEKIKRPFSIERGAILNKQHTPADGIYYITSGFAKIVWPEPNGKESIIKIAGPDDMTGYRCLFSEETFRATAIGLTTPLTGFFLPKEFFLELIRSNQNFNFEILRRMGLEIKRSENRLRSFGKNNVRERMAESLLYLDTICGVEVPNENKVVLDIQLTREELSSWIGAAKETVVRCLSDMRDEGVLDQVGNYIAINNKLGLQTIAGQL